MSIPQLKALERAALRLSARDSLQEMGAINAALAASFGAEGAAKELVTKLQEIALSGRP